VVTVCASAPTAFADPSTDPSAANAEAGAPAGAVESGPPGIATTADGRTLAVSASDETQLPVEPLTTALSSRGWIVGGTFRGDVSGSVNGGKIQVGYQIGCNVSLDEVIALGQIGGGPVLSTELLAGASVSIQGQLVVRLKLGTVADVPVDEKPFQGTQARVTLKDLPIQIDGCIGPSFLRSYAVLTSSSVDDDDITAYYGVANSF
jgi:hypothetical protein